MVYKGSTPGIMASHVLVVRQVADTTGWEVINDEKPWEDAKTDESLLSEEQLLPYNPQRKHGVRPPPSRPNSTPPQPKTKVVPVKQPAKPVKDVKKPDVGPKTGPSTAGAAPLQAHGTQRHLLQADQNAGPAPVVSASSAGKQGSVHLGPPLGDQQPTSSLPKGVALSRACKERDEDDCLYDVDDFVARAQSENTDDEVFDPIDDVIENDEEDDGQLSLSRHRRQAIEGSGLEGLYAPEEENSLRGIYQYTPKTELSVPYNGTDKLNSSQEQELASEIEASFKNVSGFVKVVIKGTRVVNGQLKVNFTLQFDGAKAAASVPTSQALQEQIIKGLNATAIPGFYQMKIFGQPIDASSFLRQEDFLYGLLRIFDDYCSSTADPCGPEYDDLTCSNTGFMAGSCKHKCVQFGPCSNGAECELDKHYKPFCNCGKRFEGEFCQNKKQDKKALSEPETVGVVLGAALVGLGLLSCCIFIVFCRRSKKNVKFSYYQDEEQFDRASSDPTIPDYYIDRPQVSRQPIRVFEPNGGFDA